MKSLRIGWWNTALTPPKGEGAPDSDRDLADSVLSRLLPGLDVFFLGEVASSDIERISRSNPSPPLDYVDLTMNGDKYFGIGMLHREHIKIRSHEFITTRSEDRVYRVGAHISLRIEDSRLLNFIVVHWPSRQHVREEESLRDQFGWQIRQLIDGFGDNHQTIVLGDFNDEPYSLSVRRKLFSSRDINLVRARKTPLYNPFWKHLSDPCLYRQDNRSSRSIGSHYYAGDNSNRWRTFDQMLFSSSFVGDGEWSLDETGTGIQTFDDLEQVIAKRSSKLDHFPIVGRIEARENVR